MNTTFTGVVNTTIYAQIMSQLQDVDPKNFFDIVTFTVKNGFLFLAQFLKNNI